MSRGRGGRGGRGGMNKTFNRDQLNAMGISNNEMLPTIVTQPPPLFSIMERRPVPLTVTFVAFCSQKNFKRSSFLQQSLEVDYLLILRQDLIDNIKTKSYSTDENNHGKDRFDWHLIPSELRPKLLAKRINRSVNKEVNVQERLKQLEVIEENKTNNTVIIVDDEEDEEEQIQEEVDEEMDDGTDYVNSHFDNGEGFDDDDDALDDGPSY